MIATQVGHVSVPVFRPAYREPTLADDLKTCFSPFFGAIRRRIDELRLLWFRRCGLEQL
jgi:hypothetical protein